MTRSESATRKTAGGEHGTRANVPVLVSSPGVHPQERRMSMALSITLTMGNKNHTFPLNQMEIIAIHKATSNDVDIKGALEVILGGEGDEMGSARRLSRDVLLVAVSRLLHVADTALSLTIFSVFGSPMPGAIEPVETEGFSGARVGEELHAIVAGVNECTLIRRSRDSTNQWREISREDIRHWDKIQTDNMGIWAIRKRSKPVRLVKELRRLQRTLQTAPDQDVLLMVDD